MTAKKYQFPKVYAAIKLYEKREATAKNAGWAIGDALMLAIGPPNLGGGGVKDGRSSYAKFVECSEELAERGVFYSAYSLQTLRNTAYAFKPNQRELSIWTSHRAGTPQVMEVLKSAAKEEGVMLTATYVKAHAVDVRANQGLGRTAKESPTRRVMLRKLSERATHAASAYRMMLKEIAESDLSDAERVELDGRVQASLSLGQEALSALKAPSTKRKLFGRRAA